MQNKNSSKGKSPKKLKTLPGIFSAGEPDRTRGFDRRLQEWDLALSAKITDDWIDS
jgi:hypothetical protein